MLAAEIEIFAHAHLAEQLPRFRALHDAASRDTGRTDAAQFFAVPDNFTGVRQKTRNGIEQRGLAGAIEADDRDEFALVHMDRNAVQRLRLAIMDADVLDLQQRRLVL